LRPRTTAVGGVLFALLFMSVAVYYASSFSVLGNPDDFNTANTSWNGLSTMVSMVKPTVMQNLTALPPVGTGYVLYELGPSHPFAPSEARGISKFVSSGGTLVLADDYGTGNSLLQGMGMTSRFTGAVLTDPLFNFKNSFLAVAPDVTGRNFSSLALNYATTLTVSDPGTRILGLSSDFSYLYPTQPGETISNAPHGPFAVFAVVPQGKGQVYLISDASVFINSMLQRSSNAALLKQLSTGTVLLDTSHFSIGPATVARNSELAAYAVLSLPEFRYSIVAVGVAGILAYRFGAKAPAEEEELKTVMEQHPEWSEERLRNLKEDLADND
jgi:hypothetical protein